LVLRIVLVPWIPAAADVASRRVGPGPMPGLPSQRNLCMGQHRWNNAGNDGFFFP
jgi:hypothetical protein